MSGKLSLTKHYVFDSLMHDIASLRPGMTFEEVRSALGSPHPELADDIFVFDDDGHLRDSVLLQTCRDGGETALRVIWVSLIAADSRLQNLLRAMSQENGLLQESLYETTTIHELLIEIAQVDSRKAASNLAHYFEQARIFMPKRHGSEIVGISGTFDTTSAAPLCIAHLGDVFGWDDPLERAVELGVHSWLNLTEDHFRGQVAPASTADSLASEAVKRQTVTDDSSDLEMHLKYIEAIEEVGIASPSVRQFNAATVENATREHRETQNKLAAWAKDRGFEIVRPGGEPLFDVGWWSPMGFFVAEVKSLGMDNEARQVRLGLGQVLDYRKQLQKKANIEALAVLAVSRAPAKQNRQHWQDLAAELDVVFCWPPFKTLDNWLRDHSHSDNPEVDGDPN